MPTSGITRGVKIAADAALAALLVTAMSFRLTGETAHEFIGVSMLLLVVLHGVFNRRWFGSVGRMGFPSAAGVMNAVVNLLLLVSMAGVMTSGIMMSRAAADVFGIEGSPEIRRYHVFFAWWALVFASLHVGFHWERVVAFTRRKTVVPLFVLRIAALCIVSAGIWAALQREIAAKLVMYYSFDFSDAADIGLTYVGQSLAISGLFVAAGHYGKSAMRTICASGFRTAMENNKESRYEQESSGCISKSPQRREL